MSQHIATLRQPWHDVPAGTRLRVLAHENLRGIQVAYVAREDGMSLPDPTSKGGSHRYARIGLNFLQIEKETPA